MSDSPARVVQSLRAVVGCAAASATPDADLLDRFVRLRDERAFAELVRRYGRIVAGACRRVLGPGPDAEDAWQATFLALACKARAIGGAAALGGWLHTVAVRVALRLRADAARRTRHEARAGMDRPASHADAVVWDAARADLRAVLDEAISRLPEKYRMPIVLCYLEGKTNEAAAAELGCPTSTVATRLARARNRLQAGLGRRGIGVTAAVLAATLADQATAAGLAAPDAVAAAATLFVTARSAAGSVPARVAFLTEGALRSMSTNQSKILAGVLATLCAIGTGSGLLALRAADRPPAAVADRGRVATQSTVVAEADADEDGPGEKPRAGSENRTAPRPRNWSPSLSRPAHRPRSCSTCSTARLRSWLTRPARWTPA
jgi:RNA polymerase sigma factor (sigma-70 family)